MAGPAADRVARHSNGEFRLATRADDAAIRRLLREQPMSGAVRVGFEREPDYFRGADLAGGVDETIVAYEGGRLVCMGRCTHRLCWVDGQPRRVGYLSELRLDASARGRFRIVRDGYRFFHERQSDDPAELYFTSIAADNVRARRLLESGARGLPRYEFLGELETLLVAATPSSQAIPAAGRRSYGAATAAHLPDMLRVLNEHGRRHQLATVWTAEYLRTLARHGLPLERFLLAFDGDALVACGGLWDQRAFRQTVIHGYSRAVAIARPLLNLLGAFRLPRAGSVLAHAFLSPLAFADGYEALLPDFIAASLPLAVNLGLDFLTLALPADDPRLAALRRRFATRSTSAPRRRTAMNAEIPGLLSRETLSLTQRDEMFSLLAQHFSGVSRDQFERDLAEKNWVVEIRRDQRLVGFSTLFVCEESFDGRALTAIYSGDTIMAPEAWNSPALARTWIAAVNRLRAAAPARPCHWLALMGGLRTYRFLPVFWREFHPRHDAPTPCDAQRLLDHLARARYGDRYDAVAGIVRFPHPQKLRALPEARPHDPHVAFFLARNPGHAAGDELVCLTEICETNLTVAGRRMIAR